MAIHAVNRGQMTRPKRQEASPMHLPAPYKGVDARSPLAYGNTEVCVYTYNLLPSDGGPVLRKGYREWQIGVETTESFSINTMIPFDGIAADGSEDRLFAVTNEGIWDVTTAGATPAVKTTFADQSEDAGFGVFITYITDNDEKAMMYADSLNGLFTYDVDADTWAQAAGITDLDVTTINYVSIHKQRIWFAVRESTTAYYLAVGAIAGAAVPFYYGSKFKNGGALRGLFSWTVDGGAGVDDMFVAVSSAGDVVVYQGSDPSDANAWAVKGVYYIGRIPKGPKFGTVDGGELYLLSTYGLVSMNDLLQGVNVVNTESDKSSARITGIIRRVMNEYKDFNGWSVRSVPSEGGLLISAPVVEGLRPIQYYYNIAIGGWGFVRDLDVRSFDSWQDSVVFGDSQNRVCLLDQEVHNVKITPPPTPEFNGEPIDFSMLTSFTSLGAPSLYKNVTNIRPDIIGAAQPNFTIQAKYDYNSVETFIGVNTPPDKLAIWDVDKWDAAVWGATSGTSWNSVYGGAGIGRNVAIAYRGLAYNRFTLVGWDVMFKVGGMMV